MYLWLNYLSFTLRDLAVCSKFRRNSDVTVITHIAIHLALVERISTKVKEKRQQEQIIKKIMNTVHSSAEVAEQQTDEVDGMKSVVKLNMHE